MYADDFILFGNPNFLIENFNIIVEEFAITALTPTSPDFAISMWLRHAPCYQLRYLEINLIG